MKIRFIDNVVIDDDQPSDTCSTQIRQHRATQSACPHDQHGRVLEAPLVSQLFFVGLLSVNLAVLNILPFPPLDGGRMAVTLIEGIRRKRLPAEREALIYLTGFAVLIALVILVSIQDIQRLLSGS